MTEYQNLLGYCQNCTDNQLKNVLIDELKRSHNNPISEISQTARTFYHAAREECAKRGINPDEIIQDNA